MKRIAFAALLLLVHTAVAQSQLAEVGYWVMNKEKSTWKPGPGPQSITVAIEPSGQGLLRVTAAGNNSRGYPFVIRFIASFDGQEFPITGYSVANSASFRRIDARTSERTDKLNGVVVQSSTWVVSPDGRQLRVEQKGGATHNVIIYDKH